MIMKIGTRFKISLDFKKVWYAALLFVFLYMPPVTNINIKYLIGVAGWIYLILHRCAFPKKIWKTIMVIGILSIYILLAGFLNMHTILNTMASKMYLAVFTFPYAMMLGNIADEWHYSQEDLIKMLGWTAFVESLFSAAAYAAYEIQTLLLNCMSIGTDNELIQYMREWRLYGLADGMTYAMPILQGIIGIILLQYALHREMRYIIFVPFICLSGLINARTTIIVLLTGILFVAVSCNFLKLKTLKRTVTVVLFAVAGMIIFNRLQQGRANAQWLQDGFREIFAFLSGKLEGYFYIVFQDENVASRFLKLPNGWGLLFGNGSIPSSDIGYIRDIWAGGILMAFMLYGIYAKMLKQIYTYLSMHVSAKIAGSIIAFLTIVLLAVNVKGEICGINEVSNLIVFLYVTAGIKCCREERCRTVSVRNANIYRAV